MPWSQTLVVNSTLAIACPGLLPSGFLRPSAFTSTTAGSYHQTTTIDLSGLNTEPASLIRLASDSRYRAYPQTSLLTCRLGFGQVGLAAVAATHPLAGNNQFLSRTGLPRLWIYLGTTGIVLNCSSIPPLDLFLANCQWTPSFTKLADIKFYDFCPFRFRPAGGSP